jgi:hypothetical protein
MFKSYNFIAKPLRAPKGHLVIYKKAQHDSGSGGRISWDRNSIFHEIKFMRSNFCSLFMRSKFLIINILQKRSGDRIGPRGP